MSSMPPPPPPPPGGMPPGAMPPAYQAYPTSERHVEYASFGSRFGALIIDGLVMFLIELPFIAVGFFAVRKALENCYSITETDTNTTSIHCPDGALQGGWLAAGIAVGVVGAIVAIIVYCKKVAGGQSWGHKAVGIRIVGVDTGQSISAGKVFARQICRFFSGLFCYLGYLWMLWDPKKQTWHDKMVSTIVIKA